MREHASEAVGFQEPDATNSFPADNYSLIAQPRGDWLHGGTENNELHVLIVQVVRLHIRVHTQCFRRKRNEDELEEYISST